MVPVHTILFPTDFSEKAQQAFPLACSLARDTGARVVALHVVPPALGQDQVLVLQKPEEYYAAPRSSLHAMKAPDENVRVEYRLADGHASTEILRIANDDHAGLIVIGTHGRAGVTRLLFGSVAEQVLRGAPCPVLAVKTGPVAPKIRTILFPTDLSVASGAALGVAFSLARDYHARLIVLHVASLGPALPYSTFEEQMTQSTAYRRELEEKLRQCHKPECNVEFRVKEGDPADWIVREAQQETCDLIVMGTHGRTGISRLLTGSVAEQTLRKAPCPVLLVKHADAQTKT